MATLKTMSVPQLQDLKSKVAISERVRARREELETELSKLDGHNPRGRRGRPAGREVRGVQ
jgi:hypothetical protein